MNEISILIKSLKRKHATLFCASICGRMYSSYLFFFEREKWGNPSIFLQSIQFLYENSLNLSNSNDKFSKRIEEIFPDLDEFEDFSASYAFDACTALYESITYLSDNNTEHITNCSTSATNTLDMFIQEYMDIDPNTPGLESIINSHPFMQKEVNNQLEVLKYLNSKSNINIEDIKFIRNISNYSIVDLQLLTI